MRQILMIEAAERPRGLAFASLSPSHHCGRTSSSGRLTRATGIVMLLLSACSPKPVPVVTAAGLCEGLRPAMPIIYDGKADTALTVKQVRQANSRFQAMCS